MHRRTLLLSAALSPFAATASATGDRTITLGDMNFTWHHQTGRLYGRLSAPGMGWLAVGFNNDRTLKGTRFLIAAVAEEPLRAEIHIALPPDHRAVEDFTGQPSELGDLVGGFVNGRSQLSFSLPHRNADRFARDLSPGRSTYLMLAWSHEPEFDHHSAWRGHAGLIL